MPNVVRRLLLAMAVSLTVFLLGTLAFWLVGGGRWSVDECAYMTVISVTTVGYGETLPGMETVQGARLVAAIVIVVGFISGGFALSVLTAALVESDIGRLRRQRLMRKEISSLSNHVIVCGVGTTGRHVVDEMVATATPFVAIDLNEERLQAVAAEHHPHHVPYVVGDATEDAVLQKAGIERARGIVAALPGDKDNLYVVVTARNASPNARIVARGGDIRVFDKLRKAGANAVVSPNFIGGNRLASEMLRPHVVEFLDEMVRDRDMNLRLEEVLVPAGSAFAGKKLRDTRIRDVTDALVLAMRDSHGGPFRYNPGPDTVVEGGTLLVVLGRTASIAKLRAAVETGFGA